MPRLLVALCATGCIDFQLHPQTPDTPEPAVPAVRVEPAFVDLGELPVGCPVDVELTVHNDGGGAATVDAVDADAQLFGLQAPFELAPGASVSGTLRLVPDGDLHHELVVYSDDPSGPAVAEQVASEGPAEWVTDGIDAPDVPEVDILFAVDSSCSMTNERERLGTHFDAFLAATEELSADWHLAVAMDRGCFASGVLTADSEDLHDRFDAAVTGEGSGREDLFQRTLDALGDECNAGFRREGALLHLIWLSDEREQSDKPWFEQLVRLEEAAGDPALLRGSAVAGPVPWGCPDAEAGKGYAEVVDATQGLFLSICDDWADALHDLAAVAGVTRLPLTQPPNEATLSVAVDGQPTDAWTYDPAAQVVRFDTALPPGSRAEATYSTATCP